MDQANYSTATLADVDDTYYFGVWLDRNIRERVTSVVQFFT
jgi:hypothetical protein